MDRAMQSVRLEARLAELGIQLESVPDPAAATSMLERFRHAAEAATGEAYGLSLVDADGRPVATAPPVESTPPPATAIRASVKVSSTALPGGSGRLDAWQSGRSLAADRSHLWREWALDLLVTSLAVVLVVELAVHLLVGRPLARLMAGLRRLEQGHMGTLDPGPGAWELRWLAWRFEHLGRDLADNARRLVAAERRALDVTRSLAAVRRPASDDDEAAEPTPASAQPANRPAQEALVRQYLEDTCRLLDSLDPGQPLSREIAEEAWSKAVAEAERIGDPTLKAQLEDQALKVLEHEAFAELDAELEIIRKRRRTWSLTVGRRLGDALDRARVQAREIQHRVKHTAGVWRKMRDAGLEIEQVHDLFAFRVIVTTVTDCYLALAAVHREFEPEPFRFKDYVERPKANGYRSLHTTVRDEDGNLFEVQIRTTAMHEAAERGGSAHWRYRTERWGSVDELLPRSRWRRGLEVLRRTTRRRSPRNRTGAGSRPGQLSPRRPTAPRP